MSNLENALQIGGYLGGISKQKYLDMEKLASNGAALATLAGRTSGMTSAFFDLYNGITTYSAGVMDTRKTTASQALTAGTTILTDKVNDASGGDSVNGFPTGCELTVQDDDFKEYVTVTNGGISTSSVIYDRSTPTTVVASAYTTSKDARPQVLSNGWIVTAEVSGTRMYFQVSKDNGANFIPLCFTDYMYDTFSIVSKSTTIYIISWITGGGVVYFGKFDASTQTNVDFMPSGAGRVNIDSSQTSFGTGCSLTINPTGTELHASFSSKNATYPNSFNIRYAKGTISAVDGSVSWGSVEQVTVYNTTNLDQKSPCIIINASGYPVILNEEHNGTSSYRIFANVFNGSIWDSKVVYNGGVYVQSSPDLISDQNGILWCCWHGLDSTSLTYYKIKSSYSSDGGLTWSSVQDLTTNSNYMQVGASVTTDKDGKVYVLWTGKNASTSGWYIIRQIIWNGSSWGSIVDITTQNSSDLTGVSTCSNYQNFTSPLVIWKDPNNSKVVFRGIFTQTTQVPHLEVTPLQNSYKTNVWCYRSLGNVDTVNGRLGFSQGFDTGGGVYVPLLSEDIRYIITPSSPVSQVVSWTDYDLDGNFSIDTKISLVNTSSPESFGTATKKTTLISEGINEDQNVYIAPSNSRITQRITISRASTSVTTKYVKKLLGAVG